MDFLDLFYFDMTRFTGSFYKVAQKTLAILFSTADEALVEEARR